MKLARRILVVGILLWGPATAIAADLIYLSELRTITARSALVVQFGNVGGLFALRLPSAHRQPCSA